MFYNEVCPTCETLFKRHKNFFKRVYYWNNFELLKFQTYHLDVKETPLK